jgi:hypothetical protein
LFRLRAGVGCAARVLAAAGPIPSDVVVARPTVSDALANALARGLASLAFRAPDDAGVTGVRRFVPASSQHLAAPRAAPPPARARGRRRPARARAARGVKRTAPARRGLARDLSARPATSS